MHINFPASFYQFSILVETRIYLVKKRTDKNVHELLIIV